MDSETRHRVYPPALQRAHELRHPQTRAEALLWTHLRNRQLDGLKFRRQHPLGHFIVDFYCASSALVVEIDGDSHTQQAEYDTARTAWLLQRGYHIVRFENADVFRNIEGVLQSILSECRRLEVESPSS